MTREFYKTGQSVPVTVLKIEKGRIIEVIDPKKRGYTAIQLGFGKIKNSKLTKAMRGFFTKKNTEPRKIIKELRVKNAVNIASQLGISEWLSVDLKKLKGIVSSIPERDDILPDINENLVVEYYSK